MSLFDMFTAPKQEAPAPAPTPTPAASEAPKPSEPGNLPTPADSPLDQFKDLWNNSPKEGENSNSPPESLDPAKLQEIVSKASFSNTVNPEVLSQISAGGEDAANAFISAMNSVAQQVMMQATLAADKLTQQRVEAALQQQSASIPDLIKQQTLSNSLAETNPTFNNPAVKPVIDAVKHQLTAKYPEATPAQLSEMAQNFVTAMSESLNPAKPNSQQQADGSSQDWEKFLSM